jgi:hypothetical protein
MSARTPAQQDLESEGSLGRTAQARPLLPRRPNCHRWLAVTESGERDKSGERRKTGERI